MGKRTTKILAFFYLMVLFAFHVCGQATHFVWKDNPNTPEHPYTNGWASAAREIDAAVTASAAGAVIWVTNGVYDAGGRRHTGATLTNRVYIDRAVTVLSVNGPSNTFIVGRWHDPGTTPFGAAAARCVYMAQGAVLAGFTVTNGATHDASGPTADRYGGGIYVGHASAAVSNCVIADNRSSFHGGGAYGGGGSYYNCVFEGNSATTTGGGAYGGTCFYNCGFYGNSANYGAGSGSGTYYDCLFTGNTAGNQGGAAFYAGAIYNSLIASNTALICGGAYHGNLVNCTIIGNSSRTSGGGAYFDTGQTAYNCVIAGNQANNSGGGVSGRDATATIYNSTIIGNAAGSGGGVYRTKTCNCTISGNSATTYGGGIYDNTNWNTIVYNNRSATSSNHTNSVFYYSCSSPKPDGDGNIEVNPLFVDPGSDFGTNHMFGNYHLTRKSQCMNKGVNLSYMTDPATNEWARQDLDHNLRIQHGTVDMGAYELRVSRGAIFSAE